VGGVEGEPVRVTCAGSIPRRGIQHLGCRSRVRESLRGHDPRHNRAVPLRGDVGGRLRRDLQAQCTHRSDDRHGFFTAPAILFSMVAVESRLWVAGGYPGTDGSLTYLSTSPLKVLAHSNVGEQSAGTLPTFGQFPVVDYSDGRVW